jgi:transporter family-2 protein
LNSRVWTRRTRFVSLDIWTPFYALSTLRGCPPHRVNSTTIAQSAWWSWTGGLFGAIYVGISIVLLPRFGAAGVVSLIVAGQMLASILFDHYELFGLASRPVDWSRITGALLLVAGVALIRR